MKLALKGVLLAALVTAVLGDCSEGDVQFVGLPVSHAGIVRVCVNGAWGTVCAEQNSPWGQKNCQVACRIAGYSGAVSPILQSTLPPSVTDSVVGDPIHYRSVACLGAETALSQCSHSVNTGACVHSFDAAVTCRPYSDAEAVPGDVRLLDSDEDGMGAVEYYDSFIGWTGICADSFYASQWMDNIVAAMVVCRQLGYEDGISLLYNIPTDQLAIRDAGPLACDLSTHFTLDACSKTRVDCDDSTELAGGVQCSKTAAEDYSVRVVGAGDGRTGVVEVAINGRWGTVCEDSGWDVEDATVVCSQLGLVMDMEPVVISNNYPDYYSQSVKPSWLSTQGCDYTQDQSLSACSSTAVIGYTGCTYPTSRSAEISCGTEAPEEGGLSGGAITGIVIGTLAGLGVIGACIHFWKEGEKKKRARQAAASQTAARQPAPSPPAPVPAPQQPPPPAEVNPTPLTFIPTAVDPPSQPTGDLVAAPPPSYQAAVNYPQATTVPSYPEKPGPYPEPNASAAYPPPTHQVSYPPPPSHMGVAPFPTAPPPQAAYPPPLGFNPAYPPPDHETVFNTR